MTAPTVPTTCESVNCEAPASFLVHWPNREIKLCPPCADRAVTVGHAMGIKIAFDRLVPGALGVCQWFALCGNPAIGVVPHPVLGNVPTCARCMNWIQEHDPKHKAHAP